MYRVGNYSMLIALHEPEDLTKFSQASHLTLAQTGDTGYWVPFIL